MGTPKKRMVFEKIFRAPDLSEKIRLLEVGKEVGKALDLEKFGDVLEEAKKTLLPLIEKLNKPLAGEVEFVNAPLPKEFKNIRGVRLYASNFIDIWLERSGSWFLRTWDVDRRTLQRATSSQLVAIIVKKRYDFLRKEFRDPEFMEEFPCLRSIAYYVMFQCILSEFFKSVSELVKKREEIVLTMKKWTELFGDFVQSLDPLTSEGKKVALQDYGIIEETERGMRNRSSGYLSQGSLDRVWRQIEKYPRGRSGHKEHLSYISFRSLLEMLHRVEYLTESTKKGDGRLPFTEEERKIIDDFVKNLI